MNGFDETPAHESSEAAASHVASQRVVWSRHALYHAGMALDLGHQVQSFLVNFGGAGNDQLVQPLLVSVGQACLSATSEQLRCL